MESFINSTKMAHAIEGLPYIAQHARAGVPWVLDNIKAVHVTSFLAVGLFTVLVYRRYLNPVADIQGPFVATFTRLWHMYHILVGDQNLQLIALHEKLGRSTQLSVLVAIVTWICRDIPISYFCPHELNRS
jgi:hypothetical protein